MARAVESATIELKLRVIVITTRAALRHAASDPAQRRAIIERGKSLLEALALDEPAAHRPAIDQAFAEVDRLGEG